MSIKHVRKYIQTRPDHHLPAAMGTKEVIFVAGNSVMSRNLETGLEREVDVAYLMLLAEKWIHDGQSLKNLCGLKNQCQNCD